MLQLSLLLPLQPVATTCPLESVHVLWIGAAVGGIGDGSADASTARCTSLPAVSADERHKRRGPLLPTGLCGVGRIVMRRPWLACNAASADCETMTTGILMAIPTVAVMFITTRRDGSSATLFTMITPTAPATCACVAFSWKVEPPRWTTTTLPATAAVFCSCGAALYGTASTISALSTAVTPAPKIASWPLANVAHVWNCGTAELEPSGVENDNVASVHAAIRHDACQTHVTLVPPARAINRITMRSILGPNGLQSHRRHALVG